MHKDWDEYEKKKQAKEAERDQKEKENIEKIRLEMEEARKQQNEQSRKKLEEYLAELQQRQENRKKLQVEWNKAYQEYMKKKPLFQIKEESYNELVSKMREDNLKWLEQRKKAFQPETDYMFKEHQEAFKKKLEELKLENDQKRLDYKNNLKLPELFHGRYYSRYDGEEKEAKGAVSKKFDDMKEQIDKRNEFLKKTKETIKIKTKPPSSIKVQPESAKHNSSVQKIPDAKDQYNMGLKYLDYSKKRVKKKLIASATLNDSAPEIQSEVRRSSDSKVNDNILQIQYPKPPEGDKVATPSLSQSKSTSRINYLPQLKQQHLEKGIKKQPGWMKIMGTDLKQQDKYNIMKANIQFYDENAKRVETRLKYASKNANKDDEAGNLDDLYLNSAKAKLALLQGV